MVATQQLGFYRNALSIGACVGMRSFLGSAMLSNATDALLTHTEAVSTFTLCPRQVMVLSKAIVTTLVSG